MLADRPLAFPALALHRCNLLLGLLLLMVVSMALNPAMAQVGRDYRIELLIFEHHGHTSRNYLLEHARIMESELGRFAIGEGPIRHSRSPFGLDFVAERVETSGLGTVLERLVWEQTGRDFARAPWIRIQSGRVLGPRSPADPSHPLAHSLPHSLPRSLDGSEPEAADLRHELEGRLRIWVGRFIHLETDLVRYLNDSSPANRADVPPGIAVRGRQRMNSGDDLFYLDHPHIGMIARVTRLQR